MSTTRHSLFGCSKIKPRCKIKPLCKQNRTDGLGLSFKKAEKTLIHGVWWIFCLVGILFAWGCRGSREDVVKLLQKEYAI